MEHDNGIPDEIDRDVIETVLDYLFRQLSKEVTRLAEYRKVSPELIWRMLKEMLPDAEGS